MTNNKQYFQNLEAISALNVLDDEVAATSSGGGEYTGGLDPDIILFDKSKLS